MILPERGELADDLERDSVEVLVRPLAILRRELLTATGLATVAARVSADAARLRRLVRHGRISLVHSNTSVVLSGAAAAAAARIPHVWHVREIYSRFGRAWPAYRRMLGTAAALPCVSRATAAQFRAGDRTTVVPDGLALDATRAPREEARKALALPPDAPVIAVLGRISDWKGQDILVRALAEPALRDAGAFGLIAGDVWPGAPARLTSIFELMAQLRVERRVRMAGFYDDVATVYGAADIVAVPSTAPDPLPGAAIEAAAAGCAVIASACGGLPEIVRDGETGRLIAPGDATALARTARELIDDRPQRERLGAAAAVHARERFAPDRLLASIQDLYDRL